MQTTHTEPLEQAFTASIIADDRLRARTREALRQTLEDCGVFGGDPARVDELLRLTDTYQTYACPARVDDESLLIAGLYGMIIILHGTGILTGEHLELGPEAFVRHLRTGALQHDDPPESARLRQKSKVRKPRSTDHSCSAMYMKLLALSARSAPVLVPE